MTDTTGTHAYAYDANGRLTGVTNPAGSGQADEAFSYDNLGNRTSWNNNTASTVSYNQADQLTGDATTTYSYGQQSRTSHRSPAPSSPNAPFPTAPQTPDDRRP